MDLIIQKVADRMGEKWGAGQQDLVVVHMGEDSSSVPVPFLFLDDIWEKLKLIVR